MFDGAGRREVQTGKQSRPQESAQGDKWSFLPDSLASFLRALSHTSHAVALRHARAAGRARLDRFTKSIVRFCPSTYPSSCIRRSKATQNVAVRGLTSDTTPTRSILGGVCARAASGHVAAAPPRSLMNSRRFTRSPRRQARAATAARQDLACARSAY
jgi:hypothetical protein